MVPVKVTKVARAGDSGHLDNEIKSSLVEFPGSLSVILVASHPLSKCPESPALATLVLCFGVWQDLPSFLIYLHCC